MIAIPAIDLREGACVQLVGGRYDAERVRRPDPVAVARDFANAGFAWLHVVDLDAATGVGDNRSAVRDILNATTACAQVGGGVRDSEAVDRLFDAGASRIVLGTRALEDPDWLAAQAERWPDRLVAAADVAGNRVLVRGWSDAFPTPLDQLLRDLDPLPLAGVLVTAVHVEGKMAGPDLELIEHARSRVALPLIVSGGIASLTDLRALDARGVDGCVIGMALYTGALDSRRVAEEFGA